MSSKLSFCPERGTVILLEESSPLDRKTREIHSAAERLVHREYLVEYLGEFFCDIYCKSETLSSTHNAFQLAPYFFNYYPANFTLVSLHIIPSWHIQMHKRQKF
jgi:hypothetical protein